MTAQNNFDLTKIYTKQDSKKINITLERLGKYINSITLTGGIVSAYYHWKYDLPLSQRKLNDLDIVINDSFDIPASLTKEFFVIHYHPKSKKGKLLMMLLDPATKIRIDIFPYTGDSQSRKHTTIISNKSFEVLSLEDLVCQLLVICNDLVKNKSVDPKYFIDMISLFGKCNHKLLQRIWNEYKEFEQDLDSIYLAILNKIKSDPQLLQKTIYCQNLNHVCDKCIKCDKFPLASNS